MRSLIRPGLNLAIVVLWAQRAQIPRPPAVNGYEDMARQIRILSTGDLLYDRLDVPTGDGEVQQNNLLLRSVVTRNDGLGDLLALCQNADPKVRTLAIASLFAREDPKVLPSLAPLAIDPAETFPAPAPVAGSRGNLTVPQTVGEVAQRALDVYLHPAGYWYGVAGSGDRPGFDDYWAKRKDRAFCASWLAVRLARASQGTRPMRSDRVARVQAVQQQVKALPEPDRYLDLLWLSLPDRCDALADEEELLQAARSLGRERLIEILQRKVPSDDPDLQPRPDGPYPCQCIVTFVLEHSKSLLKKEDATALLECAEQERKAAKRGLDYRMLTPWWSIAAAELQPEKSGEILHEEFRRCPEGGSYTDAQNRSDVMIALWRMGGASEETFLVDRFYREPLEHQGVPSSRCHFLESIGKESLAPVRTLVAHIIADPRFDTLDWSSLKTMIVVANAWTKQPVVSDEECRDLSHPFGEQNFVANVAKAEKEYPEDTHRVILTLESWRQKLRASVKEWLP